MFTNFSTVRMRIQKHGLKFQEILILNKNVLYYFPLHHAWFGLKKKKNECRRTLDYYHRTHKIHLELRQDTIGGMQEHSNTCMVSTTTVV